MKLRTAVANAAMSFAHLSGIAGKASAKAEDDEKKDPPEDDPKKDAKAEGDDPEGDDKDKKDKEAKAESDDPKEPYEDDKKDAKAEDGDDDKEEEMHGKSAAASARRRERARCAAIFSSPAAARNVTLAANLAFKTSMTRSEALAVLESTPAATGQASASRAARNPNVGTSAGPAATQYQATATRLDAAFAKAAGRRPS